MSSHLSSSKLSGNELSRDQLSDSSSPSLRPDHLRRTPPDRGIIPLEAKGRIGPAIWALYGKVDRPVILKDDVYIDNKLNDFYRDAQGWAFLLLPYIAEDATDRFEQADAAYRRAVALGITERPEIFFTCVYQFQLPEYRCIDAHADRGEHIVEEQKCLLLMGFEKARLGDALGLTGFSLRPNDKTKPVAIDSSGKASTNLVFALNTLVLHHNYDLAALQRAWETA